MKKFLAILLALALVVSCFAACGSNTNTSSASGESSSTGDSSTAADDGSSAEEEDTATNSGDLPTISLMIVCGTIPPDAEAVASALSEITAEKIGCNVEFITMEIGNAKSQMNLLLSGGDDTLDVFWADGGGTSVGFVTAAANGQALVLDDLLAPYADEMKEALGENVYTSGTVNGQLYGVGRLLDQASTTMFNLRADIAEEFGYANGDKLSGLDELTELFTKIHEKYPDTPIIGPMNGSINWGDTRVDSLGDSNMLGVLGNFGQDDTVSNYYESEEYAERIECVKTWMEMGIYMPDLMNTTEAPSDYMPAGKAFGCFAGHFSAEMNGIWSSQNFGVETATLQVYDDAVAVTPGAYYCVNPNTKNPDECAGLLSLMATDPDVVNLLVNGVEGLDYQVKEDEENGGSYAAYLDGKDVSSTGWCMGYSWTALNSSISLPFEYPSTYFQLMLDANASAKQSKAFGCQFDTTQYADALTACTNVVSQYSNPILSGTVQDVDATVAQFQQALKDAGIDEIIAGKQAQLDAFLGK